MWEAELEFFWHISPVLYGHQQCCQQRSQPGFSQATNQCNLKCVSGSSCIALCVHFLHPRPMSQKCGYEHSLISLSSDSTWSVQGVPQLYHVMDPNINMTVVECTWMFTQVPQNFTYFYFMLLYISTPGHLRGKTVCFFPFLYIYNDWFLTYTETYNQYFIRLN